MIMMKRAKRTDNLLINHSKLQIQEEKRRREQQKAETKKWLAQFKIRTCKYQQLELTCMDNQITLLIK